MARSGRIVSGQRVSRRPEDPISFIAVLNHPVVGRPSPFGPKIGPRADLCLLPNPFPAGPNAWRKKDSRSSHGF